MLNTVAYVGLFESSLSWLTLLVQGFSYCLENLDFAPTRDVTMLFATLVSEWGGDCEVIGEMCTLEGLGRVMRGDSGKRVCLWALRSGFNRLLYRCSVPIHSQYMQSGP